MLIRVGFDIEFEVPAPAPMVLMLSLHPERMPSVRKPERLTIEPNIPARSFYDSFGNCCTRIEAPAGKVRLISDAVVEDSGLPDPQNLSAPQIPVEALPDSALQFLLASRYCEVDLMKDMAWELFKNTPPGWNRVQAICDWAHNHLEFSYPMARSTRTAAEAHKERLGVCRDFTHLAVTMCRCMNIPARYTTGYLGDIGVPKDPAPMDFSAWFEAYLGDRWWTFDARHNKQRIGRVVMARGRDAVDVALTTTFGVSKLTKFVVWTDEV
jgi:transglutaminase-like putative cysteine protease